MDTLLTWLFDLSVIGGIVLLIKSGLARRIAWVIAILLGW
jgi:hypothetical protein